MGGTTPTSRAELLAMLDRIQTMRAEAIRLDACTECEGVAAGHPCSVEAKMAMVPATSDLDALIRSTWKNARVLLRENHASREQVLCSDEHHVTPHRGCILR